MNGSSYLQEADNGYNGTDEFSCRVGFIVTQMKGVFWLKTKRRRGWSLLLMITCVWFYLFHLLCSLSLSLLLLSPSARPASHVSWWRIGWSAGLLSAYLPVLNQDLNAIHSCMRKWVDTAKSVPFFFSSCISDLSCSPEWKVSCGFYFWFVWGFFVIFSFNLWSFYWLRSLSSLPVEWGLMTRTILCLKVSRVWTGCDWMWRDEAVCTANLRRWKLSMNRS